MIIREARIEDATGIAKVHVDSWRTTYAGIVPGEYLANLSYERRERQWMSDLSNTENGAVTYVAEDHSGQIAGFVCGGPERSADPVYHGELYAIYILKDYQGLGRRLTQTLARRLMQEGMQSLLLWVLADNPACKFYEALGGQRVKTSQIEIGGSMLDEVAYGWKDIHVLLPN